MSDADNENQTNETNTVNELDVLKARARTMGITHSPNIGVDALKAKIQAKLDGNPEPESKEDEDKDLEPKEGKILTETERRRALVQDATRLVRVRITCMNPAKADLRGEILTVANGVIGKVSKFIPFGEDTANGYHVPKVLIDLLESRKFLQHKSRKGQGGAIINTSEYAKEFSIEYLTPLTQAEIDEIAHRQAAQRSVE